MNYRFILLAGCVLLSGCGISTISSGVARSPGEVASGYGYIPLDALPVNQIDDADSCREGGPKAPLLKALPDLSIRFAVADFDASGNLSFGPSKVTASGNTYKAVLDYINVDVVPVDFLIRMKVKSSGGVVDRAIHEEVGSGERVVAYEVISRPTDVVRRQEEALRQTQYQFEIAMKVADEKETKALGDKFTPVTIPIYVGLGLRLSADIRAVKSDINLSGLGVIGAAAEAGDLSGTLAVQTLGVNGRTIATALPLPNKLDQTTIENGILAIGSGRAILYTADSKDEGVTTTPRVVGLYSPIGSNPLLINAIYAELSRERPVWRRLCGPRPTI